MMLSKADAARFFRRLIPREWRETLPPMLCTAAVFYTIRIPFQGKVATAELGAFWAIFFLAWARAKKEVRFSTHILYLPLVLYGLTSTISALLSHHFIRGDRVEAMLWFKMLLFPAALAMLRSVPRLPEIAIRWHLFFAFYIAGWGLIEFFVLDQRDLEHRISGPVTHVMTYSGMLLPISLVALLLWWHQRKAWQLAATVVITSALLLTFTRSVWFGWAAAVLTVLLVSRPRLLPWAAIVLVYFVTFMPMNLFSRLVSTFDTKQSSNLDRIRMLEAGVEIIRDYPVWGVGPANVKELYPLYKKQDAPRFRPPHLHNNVVQIWAERGIGALAAYFLFLALFVRECVRNWRGAGRMYAEIGVAVIVGLTYAGLFEFNFGDTEVFLLTLDLLAILIVSMEQRRAQPANEPAPALVPATI